MAEELQLGGFELKKLYARREALRIQTDRVLELRLIVNQNAVGVRSAHQPPARRCLKNAQVSSHWYEYKKR